MSKTFEQNAQKALSMVAGLKKNIGEVAKYGVKTEALDRLETDARKAIELIREVDRQRIEVADKLQQANDQLYNVREQAMVFRQTVKSNFPPEQWERFGLMDKR